MSLLASGCKIRGKGRGHALELDVDEGDFAARRKAVGLAEFLAAHGLLRARRGWICGRSSAAASLCSPTVVCLQQVAAGLLGEPRVTTISIHANIAQPFFFCCSYFSDFCFSLLLFRSVMQYCALIC